MPSLREGAAVADFFATALLTESECSDRTLDFAGGLAAGGAEKQIAAAAWITTASSIQAAARTRLKAARFT